MRCRVLTAITPVPGAAGRYPLPLRRFAGSLPTSRSYGMSGADLGYAATILPSLVLWHEKLAGPELPARLFCRYVRYIAEFVEKEKKDSEEEEEEGPEMRYTATALLGAGTTYLHA
eukprot:3244422-Rhodomonas_salina.1